MHRPRQRSILHWLIELPMRLLFGVGYIVVRLIVVLRRFLPASLILLICALIPLLGFSLQRLDRAGSWIMLGAALMLAFAAGATRSKR